jgi:hypothetical protein
VVAEVVRAPAAAARGLRRTGSQSHREIRPTILHPS